jgi:GGDEF domain-containing protein
MLALTLFLILIATANLGLGFALAVYCKVGPQRWPLEWVAKPNGGDPTNEHEATTVPVATAAPQAASSAKTAAIVTKTIDESPTTTTAHQNSAPEPAPFAPADSPHVALLRPLLRGFDMVDVELAEWDARQRASEQDPDSLANAAVELGGLAVGYAQQFQNSVAALDQCAASSDAARDAFGEIDAELINLQQQMQAIAAEGTLSDAPLSETLRRIHEAIHAGRNHLEEPLVTLVQESLATSEELAAFTPHATYPLLGRLALEYAWRESGAGVAVMFDVDNLGEFNAKSTSELARSMLLALAKVLRGALPSGATLVRIHGQQFVLCLAGSSLDRGAETAERSRQQVERTTFQSRLGELQVTVSAAVIERQQAESARDGLVRLRSTIREAKSYGRNRTFLLEDDIPTPVVPPKLSLPATSIDLHSISGKP